MSTSRNKQAPNDHANSNTQLTARSWQPRANRRNLGVLLASASIMALLAITWNGRPAFAVALIATTAPIVALCAIDIAEYRLPNAITYPLGLASAIAVVLVGILEADSDAIGRALLAGLTLTALYFTQVIISWGKGMGLGDVKLAFSLGTLLGYLSWGHVIVATIACYLVAATCGIILILTKRATRKTHIPFGPFMAGGYFATPLIPLFVR